MFKRTSSFSPPSLSEAGASSSIQQEAHHCYLPEEERVPIYGQLIEFYSLVFQCIQIIRLTDYRVCPMSWMHFLLQQITRFCAIHTCLPSVAKLLLNRTPEGYI